MCEEYIESERELYHFHFSSKQLCEDFVELNVNTMYDNLQWLQEMLLKKFPDDADEIRNQITKLLEMYLLKSRQPLIKIKETAKAIFTLPPNVALSGLAEEKVVSPKEFEQLRVEVDELERQYNEEVYYRAQLKKEMKKFEHIEPLSKKVEDILKFYENNKPKPGTKTVNELFDALKTCETFYHTKKVNDEDKLDIVDDLCLFAE